MAEEMSVEMQTIIARCLRASTIKSVMEIGYLTRAEAEDLLNASLSPDDPGATVFDDRAMLDWDGRQFEEFLKGEWDESKSV